MCCHILDSDTLVTQCSCKVDSQSDSFSYFFSISISNVNEEKTLRLSILGPTMQLLQELCI